MLRTGRRIIEEQRLALARARLAGLCRAAGVTLRVEDDGAGFEPDRVREGTGLAALRRRAERLGATLVVDGQPGAGARVERVVPEL